MKVCAQRATKELSGLELTDEDYLALCKRVQAGDGLFIEKQSNRLSVWRVDLLGCVATVVYDKRRNRVASVLNLEPPLF